MEKLEHDLMLPSMRLIYRVHKTTYKVLSIINAFETTNSVKKFFDFCSQALQDCGGRTVEVNRTGRKLRCSIHQYSRDTGHLFLRRDWTGEIIRGKEFAIVATMAERAKMLLSILSRLDSYKGEAE